METTARLTFEKVRHDQEKDLHLVITLAAPHLESGSKRPPVCVIPVIDVSGSMAGQKIHFARQSVMKLVDHLAPGDFCGLVAFSTEVATVAPPAEITQERRHALKAAVGRLEPLDSTNLAGGMLRGLELTRGSLPPGMRARVILFTDGLANVGPATRSEEILQLLQANLGEATLSAFGYGADADQELLRDLSTRGKGNYAFVRGPEDALTAFARELGGLLSTAAQDVELRVTPRGAHRITGVVSDVDAEEKVGAVVVRLPDLLAGEARQVVLEMRLAAQPGPRQAPVTVVGVEAAWQALEGHRPVRRQATCQASVQLVAAGEEQEKPTHEVDAIVAAAQLVRAQIEAEEKARAGHYAQAGRVMRLYQMAVVDRGHGAAAQAAGRVADAVSDQAAYAGSAAYRSSMRKGASRGAGSTWQDQAASDLGAMGLGKPTEAQQEMEKAFGVGEGGAGSEAPAGPAGRDSPGHPVRRRKSRRW